MEVGILETKLFLRKNKQATLYLPWDYPLSFESCRGVLTSAVEFTAGTTQAYTVRHTSY